MELVNKIFKAVVDGVEKNVAPATRSDNVYLASNQEKTIEEGLISVYTHSKSGTVHEFTGVGPNGRALMTADVEIGDTFTVNGIPVTAYMGTNDATNTMIKNQWNNKWVAFVIDNKTLNFLCGNGNEPILVWENPQPDTEFASQTISVDLAGFTHILAEGKRAEANKFTVNTIVRIGEYSSLSLAWQTSGSFLAYERTVYPTENEVYFGPGNDVAATSVRENNKTMVPQRIYGIKMFS